MKSVSRAEKIDPAGTSYSRWPFGEIVEIVCSAPPVSRMKGDWAQHLGEMRGEAWPMADGASRLRVTFRHPMDTGFVANIPTYHIEQMRVTGPDGQLRGQMEIWAAVAEDPARQEVEREQFAADLDRVARVRTALEPHDDIGAVREDVDDLALALVAELASQDYCSSHPTLPRWFIILSSKYRLSDSGDWP